MHLNFTANSFVFGRINREIVPRTFSVKLASGQLPECVWTSPQTASFLDAQIVKLGPELHPWKLRAENFQKASELHGKQLRFRTQKSRKCTQNFFHKSCKAEDFQNASELYSKQLRFWTPKSWNCPQNFFCETCRQKTSKRRLNFTENTFVFGRKYLENAPRSFFLTCKVKTSKILLDFTANSFVFARKNRENAPKTFL